MFLLNTGCRPEAARDLTVFQVDLARDRLDLNPPGRRAHQQGPAGGADHQRVAAMADRRRPRASARPRREVAERPVAGGPRAGRARHRRGALHLPAHCRDGARRAPTAPRPRSSPSWAGSSATACAAGTPSGGSTDPTTAQPSSLPWTAGWPSWGYKARRLGWPPEPSLIPMNLALRASNLQAKVATGGKPLETLERAKGFEPSTPTLARLCSTPELRPHRRAEPAWRAM